MLFGKKPVHKKPSTSALKIKEFLELQKILSIWNKKQQPILLLFLWIQFWLELKLNNLNDTDFILEE